VLTPQCRRCKKSNTPLPLSKEESSHPYLRAQGFAFPHIQAFTYAHMRSIIISSAQQQRSDSTAVTVSSEIPCDSPSVSTEPADQLPESPVDDIPAIEVSDVGSDEPPVVAQVEESREARPPPRVSLPDTAPTTSGEEHAVCSIAPLQNGVTEVAGCSSSESSANEEPVPATQPAPAPPRETLAVPSNSDTTELVSPVESEVFVYPVDSSPPQLIPATTEEAESPEDDVFHYPTAEPVEPTPAEPVAR
jgi:hypothetical protein